MFWILTRFLMWDLDETFTEASAGWTLSSDTTTRFIRNLHVHQDSRKRLGGKVESWHSFWLWILIKLSPKVQMDLPFPLTPSPDPSGTYMSSKTPGSDLEDRSNLDTVSDYGSWWNFHRSFRWIVPLLRHHLKVHQEPSYPPRLQEVTWRIGGVLTQFLTMDLDETFTEGSDGLSLCYDTISRFIRNLPVL